MIESGVVYHHRRNALDVPADFSEVFRYLGIPRADDLRHVEIPPESSGLVSSAVEQMHGLLRPQSLYAMFPVRLAPEDSAFTIEFAGQHLKSRDLTRNLAGCTRLFLVAATIGPQVDALIRRWTKLDSAKAAVMQAAGSMFMESYLDELNAFLSAEASKLGFVTKPRYSPGYGDVPLDVQRIFFSLLPCAQKISLTLTDSLLMLPEKSVTAFIGLKAEPSPAS